MNYKINMLGMVTALVKFKLNDISETGPVTVISRKKGGKDPTQLGPLETSSSNGPN
jgi:hypothetical protein